MATLRSQIDIHSYTLTNDFIRLMCKTSLPFITVFFSVQKINNMQETCLLSLTLVMKTKTLTDTENETFGEIFWCVSVKRERKLLYFPFAALNFPILCSIFSILLTFLTGQQCFLCYTLTVQKMRKRPLVSGTEKMYP